MAKPIIEVRNVSKRYRLGELGASSLRDAIDRRMDRLFKRNDRPAAPEFWAVKDVSFDVQPGEVIGIIGRNGAGKSTLLKVLSRITEPTTGEITLRGRLASLLEVGTGFHPELSGRDNVFLNGAILGMRRTEIARKFDEIVAFAEIGEFIDTPVKRYSSGMYVRLAFAVAAHLEPEILLVDEVLAVGDVDFQRKCLGKMEDISRGQQRTILFVSHNMTAIRRLCTNCVLLERGRPSQVMPVDEAVERYSTQHASSARVVSLADRERHSKQGRSARILTMGVVGDGALSYGQPGFIEITFELKESVRGLMVGLGFDTLEGQRLLTLDSDTHNAPWDLRTGRHTVRVGLNFWPLHPGSYSISTAVISGHNCLDSVSGAAIWEVQTSEADNVSDRGFGAVRPKPVAECLSAS
ncbi:MAG: ABC transporter ATP-binding protein [Terrimicrobiaceae bacterium]|nr:ABC transporter ATP-binding protein [Terrimicrobiaceae bacterium]